MEQNKENKERYGIIYKITNTVNGKVYIGQTTEKRGFNGRYHRNGTGIERVYKHHKSLKEHNIRYNVHLLGAIEKYGFEAFEVDEEFDVASSKEELDSLECKYIKEFNCIENGYNNTDGGSNGKPSEETCKKISEKAKERCKDPEYRRKQSEARKGKYCGENNPMYGKHHTEEGKMKISESRKGKYCGENNPMYGKQRTEEEKMKISESRKGKYCGENHPLYGKHRTEEQKRKQSEAMKGKYCGENHPNARKVICLNDNKIFNTGKECAEYYKLAENTILKICKGITKKSRTGLVFMYYDEFIQQQEQQDQAAI